MTVKNHTLSIILIIMMLLPVADVRADNSTPQLISELGLSGGMIFPYGDGVLKDGAYSFGLSAYLTGTHITRKNRTYEILCGGDLMADYGGGLYLAVPLMINRTVSLISFYNNMFSIYGFAGLGYSFHHIYTRTEGITVKDQHTLGIDAGLKLIIAFGSKWSVNVRGGAYHAFTKNVKANFAGTSITSRDKFSYTTLPLLVGVSRKFSEP